MLGESSLIHPAKYSLNARNSGTSQSMARDMESRACQACAKAKRKCGKQTPYCIRCKRREIECRYPAATSIYLVPSGSDYSTLAERRILHRPTPQLSTSVSLSVGVGVPELRNESLLAASWFASPETWKIYHYPEGERRFYCSTDLRRIIRKTHRWLTQWVEKGSCPFIHSQLYQNRASRCVQDAYMAFTSYNHKNTTNEHLIFEIVYSRAKDLVVEYNTPHGSAALDAFGHLARVHALLLYQVIGFHNCDIRLRHLAESHTPVLKLWMQEMVEHASRTVSLGSCMMPPDPGREDAEYIVSDVANSENLLWYSWIVAEASRRTFVIASGVQGIYETVKQGHRIQCQGGMMFTTREGVWEAQSAFEWEKLCSEMNVGFMRIEDAEKLFLEGMPDGVDDFAKGILETTFGVERMERWGVKPQD